jgi:predicted RND superfamily exporter protein
LKIGREITDLPVRRPGLALVLCGVVTLILAAGLPRLSIDASIESMIVLGDADHAAFDEKKAIFGGDEVVGIAIPFADALTPASLAVQRRIADRVALLPEVTDVDALVTTDDILGEGDTLVVDPLVPEGGDLLDLGAAAQAHIRERVATNQLWSGFLISRDLTTAALQVHLEDAESPGGDRGMVLERIETVVREELGEAPFFVGGHPFMKTEIARTMQRDLRVFLPVSLAVMSLILILAVGSTRMAFILLGAVLLAVVWMLGLMGWVGQPLTALSNTAPSILLALGTAYFMHLAASYQKEVAAGGAPADVVERALVAVRRPTMVAGVTTAIGFGSLVTSRIPMLRGFGVDLAIGILVVVVIACLGIPAVLLLSAPGPGRGTLAGGAPLGRALFRLSCFDRAHAPLILAGAGLLLVGAVILGSRLEIDSSGPNAFAEGSPFRVSSEFYRKRVSGDVIENVYLEVPESGGFKDPDRLRRMLEFQEAVTALPEIDKTISIANYVALMNRAMYANDPAAEHIPETKAAVAQFLLLYSFSGDLEEFDDLVDADYSQARIVLNASVPSSAASAALRTKLTKLALRYFPEEAGPDSVLSTEILLSQAADSVAQEQVRSFASALILIVIVVMLAFRSFSAGGFLLLPNGLPIALYLGTMALLGMALSESTAVIAVIGLGIAVDGTVHLLAAIRRSESRHGSLPGAIVHAMQTTGRPVVVTTLTVAAGFSVLLLSDFKLISEFGGLTALTIVYCLAADLLLLPAQLLMGRARRRTRQEAELTTSTVAQSAALLTFDGRAVPALLIQESGEKASFRLMGEESGWRGWRDSPVRVEWLNGEAVARGQIAGLDEVATPVLRVEWEDSPRREAGQRVKK